ncbi:uncharacterized protein LOC143264125 isoform X2 [Megachile rotundata]|uniref:uncharacterized protein LOC143264125 isoform X2 n=1 Tax=Megachile rotundata TaxID=143995 RepID=UPI003FD03924
MVEEKNESSAENITVSENTDEGDEEDPRAQREYEETVDRTHKKETRAHKEFDNMEEKRNEMKTPMKGTTSTTRERLVPPVKRGRGRPGIERTGSVGRPRKVHNRARAVSETVSNNSDNSGDEYRINEPEDREDFDDDPFMENANLTVTLDPMTWEQAKESEDADAWKTVLEDEHLAYIRNETWEIVARPPRRRVIGNRFVFCTKMNGESEKKKVRLVAKGCSQKLGEDCQETYSPVVRSTSIRLLAVLSAELGLEIH